MDPINDDAYSAWSTTHADKIYVWDTASSPEPPRRWMDHMVRFFAAIGGMFAGISALRLAWANDH